MTTHFVFVFLLTLTLSVSVAQQQEPEPDPHQLAYCVNHGGFEKEFPMVEPHICECERGS